VHVHEHFFHGHSRALRNRLDDPQVGLVRHDEVDVFRGEMSRLQHVRAGSGHSKHGALEDFLPLENPVRVAVHAGVIRVARAHAFHDQRLPGVAVTAQPLGKQAFLAIGRLEHDGGAAIAEQHGHAAVVPVHEGADQLAAEHQRVAHYARTDHGGRRAQAIEKTGAGRVDIHGRRLLRTQAHLDAGRLVGHLVVETARAEYDQLEVGRIHAGSSERTLRGHVTQLLEIDVRYAPFPDAGAADDPLVVGLYNGGEFGVGQDGRWHALAPTRNCCVRHLIPPRVRKGRHSTSFPTTVERGSRLPAAARCGMIARRASRPRRGGRRRA